MRMKSTTVLLEDKRVSWFNVNCVRVEQLPDGYNFIVYWKYKASVREELFKTSMKPNEINKYFERFGLVALDDYYVNLSKILITTENQIFGPVEKSRIHMIFDNGYEINKVMEATKWSWWKQTFM